ncbi:uncharacterized protein LOC117610787 [Osmia lignaria lignaria]|uniref:uncharacterized protein LOC117610787 n=1 Tax=Osmia lignaria lignaria TaxID=1437193 RepID=UPI00402B5EAF
MDARDFKARDFVSVSKNFTERMKNERWSQIKWLQRYEWLLEEQAKLNKELEELWKEKQTVLPTEGFVREGGKTCLPAPVTTSGEYGWLASKPKFQLEKYGSYIPQYPDPLKDVVLLTGNIPLLAAGKGFIL